MRFRVRVRVRIRVRVRFRAKLRSRCSDYNLPTLQSVILKFRTGTLSVLGLVKQLIFSASYRRLEN